MCPHCAEPVPGPFLSYAQPGQLFRTNRDCPGCARPLVCFKEGPFAGGWRPDEGEDRRRRFIASYS